MSWARADSESTFAACAAEEAATTKAGPSRERDHCNMEGPVLCEQHLAPRSGLAMARDAGTRAALKSDAKAHSAPVRKISHLGWITQHRGG